MREGPSNDCTRSACVSHAGIRASRPNALSKTSCEPPHPLRGLGLPFDTNGFPFDANGLPFAAYGLSFDPKDFPFAAYGLSLEANGLPRGENGFPVRAAY